MERVKGIGGIFFKSERPPELYAWYEKHLGLKREAGGVVLFPWRYDGDDSRKAFTVWSLFPRNTGYFEPSRSSFMVNYIVDDLDNLLMVLREEGVEIDEKREDSEYGRFAWIMDPEGNRIELWEPPRER